MQTINKLKFIAMKKTTQAVKLAALLEKGSITDVTKNYVNDPVLKYDIEAGSRTYLFKPSDKRYEAVLMCVKDIGRFLSEAYKVNFGV